MNLSRKIWLVLSITLTVFACGGEGTLRTDGPLPGSALQQLPVEDRRIAIVHSETTKQNFYDAFAYNQLFAAMQHQSRMAGIPYEVLSETDLSNAATLLNYDAILLPEFSNVREQDRASIRAALLQVQAAGVAIVTSGEFMAFNANGQAFPDAGALIADLLGVRAVNFLSGVAASVNVVTSDHPATADYTDGEQLVAYDQLWFGAFEPVSGEQSTLLSTVTVSGTAYSGAQIIERAGRVVHFANEQVMTDNNLLWSVLQWVVYGDTAPVSLQLSRNDSIFIARNDMDQAMVADQLQLTEIPLLEMIRDWKRDYGFVGSYYIDIGNDVANYEYTDWSVSGPLYRDYIALGNEIGTHSWTHPHYTSLLTDAQLEFEFNQSKNEISTNVGNQVIGGAVPGNAESLEVVENLNQWFEYFSGRSGRVGIGYPGAIGFLEPQHDMLYFSLNMSPDFTLIDVLNRTPAQATAIWQAEIDQLLEHGQKPILHWLWHDYGPTTETTAGTYSKEMFTDTIAYASSKGVEFTTLANLHDRIRTFQSANLSVGTGTTIDATVDASEVGQFSLKLGGSRKIKSVANWYAYDDQQVFLPDAGGSYSITTGDTPDQVTRITKLPMRARLMTLSGDDDELSFTFEGEGEVSVELSPGMINNARVSGATSFVMDQGTLKLTFPDAGTHSVSITAIQPINKMPVAQEIVLQVNTAEQTDVVLSATDPDNDALTYSVLTQPENGTLSGDAPALVYQSDVGFRGTDSFTYIAGDGQLDSAAATVQISVVPPRPANSAPVANRLVLATVINQALSFILSGSDNENQALTFNLLSAPANGLITGTLPNITYTPDADFSGIDQLEFTVNDGEKTSEPTQVVFNVEPQLSGAGGTLSNALDNVTIDGSHDEWSGAISFGTDPNEISGPNNNIDWREAWMGHDANNYYIAYQQYDPVSLTWGHTVHLDSDTDIGSGFRGFNNEYSIGVDYSIEGSSLFRFTGITQNEWSWVFVGTLDTSVMAERVELALPRNMIGSPLNLRLLFQGNSVASGGDALDFYPDDVVNSLAIEKDRRFSYSVDPNENIENIAPVANAQKININNNATLGFVLSGFDLNGDSLSYQVVSGPQHGVLSGVAPALTYVPESDYTGPDSISFIVNDGSLSSNAVTVAFTVVNPPRINSTPVANSQTVLTIGRAPLDIVLDGSDADGSALSVTLVTQPQSGTLSGTAPNLTYIASEGFSGEDSFTFKVNDGSDDSAVATVAITVEPVPNVVPVANIQNLSTEFETPLALTLTGSDADGQTLAFSVTSQPSAGTLQGTAPELTYVPDSGASGVDTFSFTVSDGEDESEPATISIDVQMAVNTLPVANSQSLVTDAAGPLQIVLDGSDAEGSALTFTVVTQPQSGLLNGTAPNLTYTANDGFTGSDEFTFRVNDGTDNSTEATVLITVEPPPNTPPVANAQNLNAEFDTSIGIVLTGSDAENQVLGYTVTSQPAAGSLQGIAPDLIYIPDSGSTGVDTFTFTVSDGEDESVPATISIDVQPAANTVPVANSQSVVAESETPIAIVLDGTDAESSALTFALITQPQSGTLSGTAPNLTYTATQGFTGDDSFTFTVNDGTDESTAAIVTITVNQPPNSVPTADAQNLTTEFNSPVAVVLTGSDAENQPLTYSVTSQPTAGTLQGTAPDLTYVPNSGSSGIDTFSFTVSDGLDQSAVAIISIDVLAAVNIVPVADAQSLVTTTGTPLPVTLSGSDAEGSTLNFSVLTQPLSGELTGAVPTLIYTANDGFSGTDSFTFRVNDGTENSAVATISITVEQPPNSAPVANDQNLSTGFETALGLELTGSDADGQPLSYTVVAQPVAGILQGTAPELTYVPFSGTSGVDTFSFIVSDGIDSSAAATVSIEVQAAPPVNLSPIANGQTLSTPFEQAIGITLTAIDPEGAALGYLITSSPNGGLLSGTAPNLVYTPANNFSGLDSFRFIASDGNSDSTEATVTIDVGMAPNGPVSNPVVSMTVDGDLSDWNGVSSFGLDPDDVTGPNNPLDWREAWVAHSPSTVYVAYRNDQAFQLSWGHGIYIDVDSNPNTGFSGSVGEIPIGADYLIEAAGVHRYIGSGQDWSWTYAGAATITVNGDVGELSVPRSLLENPQAMQLYFRADNTPFGGNAIDHYPDAALDPAADPVDRKLFYSFGQ